MSERFASFYNNELNAFITGEENALSREKILERIGKIFSTKDPASILNVLYRESFSTFYDTTFRKYVERGGNDSEILKEIESLF